MRTLICKISALIMIVSVVSFVSCGSEDEDEDPKVSANCLVSNAANGADYSVCVDFENITSALATDACANSYSGTYTEGSLCDVATGVQGCTSTDAESSIKTTVWLSGSSWSSGDNATNSICEGATATTKE